MPFWKQAGYDTFAKGTFGNGGQNLYVSRAGVLQRIFRFDLNCDGWFDLVVCNSQDFNERPPLLVCSDLLGAMHKRELPTLGAYSAVAGDLNGDGFDEVVIANQSFGDHTDVTAIIYYGGPEGLTERYRVELPAPNSRAVAMGDFNGDGRVDLAFASNGKLRIFYQLERGFLAKNFVDIDLEVTHLTAADLDGDGCAELYVRINSGEPPRVLWGGSDGIRADRFTIVGEADVTDAALPSSTPGWVPFAEGWTPRILDINGKKHLFRRQGKQACFFPVGESRSFGEPLALDCEGAVSAAMGDVNGDGREELVVAVCKNVNAHQDLQVSRDDRPAGVEAGTPESSWVYWPQPDGWFSDDHRTALTTVSARDVAVADLNGDGRAEIIITQGRTEILNTTESLIYRGTRDGIDPEPIRIETHDATTALVVRASPAPLPEVVFINHVTGHVLGIEPVSVFWGGPDGFHPDRRLDLPAWANPDAQICDFNDDGWPEIFVSNCAENAVHIDPGAFVYWGGPEGFREDRKTVLPTHRGHGSAVGDFRHSGYLDIAVAGGRNCELLIFHGGPDGFDIENPQRISMNPDVPDFRAQKISFFGEKPEGYEADYGEVRWMFAADFNNNGWLDLFVSQIYGPRSLILWGGPEGYSMERCTWLHVEGAACAQAADLNGDGWLELIVGGHACWSKKNRYDYSNVYIYWGGPEGFREDRVTQLPAHACNSLTVADFNNDGVLDIFATSYHSTNKRDLDSYIYWGKPGGIYSAENRTRIWSHSASGCIAADFNEDGWVDLAVANHRNYGSHPGHAFVWWNGPQGFNEQNRTYLPTTGPHGMLPVDPGNIMDRGPEEYYISSSHQLPEGAQVKTIRWEAELQPKTWVKAQLRFAKTEEGLATAPWQESDAGEFNQTGSWIQYRLALGAINGGNSPRVHSVEVEYDV